MTSPQKHLLVKDSHVIASILKDLEIREYDPQIINLLLEFNHSNLIEIQIFIFVFLSNLFIITRIRNTHFGRCQGNFKLC